MNTGNWTWDKQINTYCASFNENLAPCIKRKGALSDVAHNSIHEVSSSPHGSTTAVNMVHIDLLM